LHKPENKPVKNNAYICIEYLSMKNISKIGFIALIAISFSSCLKKDNYSNIPAILFKSFVVNSDGSATLQVTFTDGDGDIGSQSTTNAPTDFYIEVLKDSVNTYKPQLIEGQNNSVMGDTLFVGYSVPYITPSGTDKELSGDIQVALGAGAGTWYLAADGSYYEYRIWLIDRAGHVSNRILTPPVQCPTQ
jgi:hypothetical protein